MHRELPFVVWQSLSGYISPLLEAVEVSDKEIDEEYARIASVYNVPVEDVKRMINSEDVKADLKVAGAMKKVKEYAKANAKASK